MTEPLQRDEVIGLLDRLASAEDAEVLAAARQLQARLAETGTSWENLLVPDTPLQSEEPQPEETLAEDAELEDARPEDPQAQESPPVAATEANGEALKQIETLLARPGISGELREELESYRSDIAAGDFTDADRRYLQALHGRLS